MLHSSAPSPARRGKHPSGRSCRRSLPRPPEALRRLRSMRKPPYFLHRTAIRRCRRCCPPAFHGHAQRYSVRPVPPENFLLSDIPYLKQAPRNSPVQSGKQSPNPIHESRFFVCIPVYPFQTVKYRFLMSPFISQRRGNVRCALPYARPICQRHTAVRCWDFLLHQIRRYPSRAGYKHYLSKDYMINLK